MPPEPDTLLEFPCEYPLKVMGEDRDGFRRLVGEIVERHAGAVTASARPSRDGRYVALSYAIDATSREQLDALYRELTAHERVLFVL